MCGLRRRVDRVLRVTFLFILLSLATEADFCLCGRLHVCLCRCVVFADIGIKYSLGGDTGNTMNSHRLIEFAGSLEKQNELMEELFLNYFSEGSHLIRFKCLNECPCLCTTVPLVLLLQ